MSLVSCVDGSMSLSENPNAVVDSSLSFLCNKSCNSKIVQKPKACVTDCSDASWPGVTHVGVSCANLPSPAERVI